MSIVDKLNPLKKAWWKRDEWHQVDQGMVMEVVETNGCSWDVRVRNYEKYKHKDNCEVRYRRRGYEKDLVGVTLDWTLFENPYDDGSSVSIWGNDIGRTTRDIDFYDGGTYE